MSTETPKEITTEILAMTTQAERTFKLVDAFKIDSDETYILAAEQLKKIKNGSRGLTESRLSITRPMDESKKNTMAFFAKPLDFLAKAETAIKKGMVAYQEELEKKRLADQKILDDKAEALRKEEEEERLKEEAKAAQEKKDNPDAVIDEPVNDMTAPVLVNPMSQNIVLQAKSKRPVVKGVSVKKIWSAEIVDEKKILEAVLAGTIPMAAITINQPFFNSQAKALKEEFNYPGVVAKSRNSIGA